MKKRIIVAVTGATGSIYGQQLLQQLRDEPGVETHLIVSRAGALTIATELRASLREIESLADVVHSDQNIGASIASGSFQTHAMIVAPCSMNTLAGIAAGIADSLILRAADVTLKERRCLVLLVRESPLHLVHLRNMTTVTEMGGVVAPPMPAFYANLESMEDMVAQTIARTLDLIGIDSPSLRRWPGVEMLKK